MIPIPKTYCVTLQETPSRKLEAQRYFSQVGLKAEFFDGIHASSFGLKTTIPNYSSYPGREYFITEGHVGCILSHYMLWNVLIYQPEEEFLIVEDDIILCENFYEKFAKIKLELPDDWEFVYVGWIPKFNDEQTVRPVSTNVVIREPYGTHAYMVKKSALKILIETNKLAWNHVDLQIIERSLPKLKYYAMNPSLVSQRSVKRLEDANWNSLCYDWKLDAELTKTTQETPILMGDGWHPLEKNSDGYMVWSDGRGEFLLNDEWESATIEFIAEGEIDKKIRVVCPPNPEMPLEIIYGKNTINITLGGSKSIILITDTFRPIDLYKTSDNRRLGLRILNGLTLTDKKGKSTFVSLYSMYGQKRSNSITSTVETMKVTKCKYNYDGGKINLNQQISFTYHRSGLEYMYQLLSQYNNENAVMFDTFVEKNFAWHREEQSRLRFIPYRVPWIGLMHNPPNMPNWFGSNGNSNTIVETKEFQESLGMCKGLYTLSQYHANFLKCIVKNVPIESLYFPTEIPSVRFNFDEFVKNMNKKVVNIGFWLRKFHSIYQLETDPSIYQKIKLTPPLMHMSNVVERGLEIESRMNNNILTDNMMKSVIDVKHMPNEEYDELLSKNIVFLDLYDASANNIVLECIARGTPLLVNPLPAVIEYLGKDYPFYFSSLSEASFKLKNLSLINQTHKYLMKENIQERISGEYFIKSIKETEIWKSL